MFNLLAVTVLVGVSSQINIQSITKTSALYVKQISYLERVFSDH